MLQQGKEIICMEKRKKLHVVFRVAGRGLFAPVPLKKKTRKNPGSGGSGIYPAVSVGTSDFFMRKKGCGAFIHFRIPTYGTMRLRIRLVQFFEP
jgi:hypothetical protein